MFPPWTLVIQAGDNNHIVNDLTSLMVFISQFSHTIFIKFSHVLINSLTLLISCLWTTQKETKANQICGICVKKYSSENSNDFTGFMNIVCENWLMNSINEVILLQYDCYLQLGLLMFIMTSFVVRFNFIVLMFWVPVLKFEMNPMEEA